MKVRPFDSFKLILSILTFTGYMKPLEDSNPQKERWHRVFRIFTILVMILYDLQHTVFIFQVLGNIELMVASLFTLIVTVNVTFKLIVLFVNGRRFEELLDVINGPFFEARTKMDEHLLQENTELMNRVTRVIKNTVFVCTAFWFIVPFINRMSNENLVIPAYFPFETKTFIGFSCATIYDSSVMFWVGYGHMTCNCFIAALYSQACVQLRIIRYNLEHIADDEEESGLNVVEEGLVYRDLRNEQIAARFIHFVERFQNVIWFVMKIETILSTAMIVQFLASAGVICMVVYKMGTISIGTEFMYSTIYLSCLLVELFLYCYFGTLLNDAMIFCLTISTTIAIATSLIEVLRNEELASNKCGLMRYFTRQRKSKFVNESMYLSDWVIWVSLSPKFRRLMLIAMLRWDRPVEPLAAKLVPVSLNTFIKVLRVAYTLYTVLKES